MSIMHEVGHGTVQFHKIERDEAAELMQTSEADTRP
jgi:hypothetical protein